MELRHIFTRDILSDPTLTAVYAFCVTEAQPTPTTTSSDGEYIDLKPYEVFVSAQQIRFSLRLDWDEFTKKVEILGKLRRARTTVRGNEFLQIELLNLAFPINPTIDTSGPEDGVIPISFTKWKEIDHQAVKSRWTPKYLELVDIALAGFERIVGDKTLKEIDITDCNRYVTQQQSRKVKRRGKTMPITNTSINNYVRALKSSFERGVVLGYLKVNPLSKVKPLPETRKAAIIFEREEFKDLLAKLPHDWLRPIFKFALQTGMRREEINNLKWEDIDFESKTIEIRCSVDFRPKFGKERTLVLTPKVEQLLDQVRANQLDRGRGSTYVFTDDNGKRLYRDRLTKECKAAAEFAGLREELHFHAIRRTFATHLKQAKVNENVIKGILGHASTVTTNKYIGTPADDMTQAMKGIDYSAFFPY